VASTNPPEHGTLVIAAYLLLTLAFAGCWIFFYAQSGQAPWDLLPWFGGAAIGITMWALAVFWVRMR
jgi:hypothetical protein